MTAIPSAEKIRSLLAAAYAREAYKKFGDFCPSYVLEAA